MMYSPFQITLLLATTSLTAIIDIMFGMGFGLTMTPILLASGYSPHEIVPALLLSSLFNLRSSICYLGMKSLILWDAVWLTCWCGVA